jgi:hypothetical protein
MPSLSSTNTTQTGCGCASPACPDCGGLECLCRPRFFAGQLLTDEDLQRLDHYIVAKNKLHNRYLMGWGVVCGLEVVCNTCEGGVTVRPGYALSPCGDDIVVCSETPVDVCSLIQQCRKTEPRNCRPQPSNAADPCNSVTEKWILSIHYDEQTSRGVIPLKNTGGAACCSKCACGGSSSCGCRCHTTSRSNGCGCNGTSKSNGSNGARHGSGSCGCSPKATQSPQCEPTVVCEGYRFSVCKIVGEPPAPKRQIVQRFLCCYQSLAALLTAPPADPALLQSWCCTIRDNLLDYLADNPGYSCTVIDQLSALCIAGADPNTIKSNVVVIVGQFLKDCLCSIFLPPCPCPVEDGCVPLATVTISRKDGVCRVISICNFDARKFLTTFPNLAYWLSELPFAQSLRNVISRICCTPLRRTATTFGNNTFRPDIAAGRSNAANAAASQDDTAEFAHLVALAYMRRTSPVDVQTLALASLGLSDPNGSPFLTDAELQRPLETLFLNLFGVPLVDSLVGGFTGAAKTGAATGGLASNTGNTAAQPDLRKEVEELTARLKQAQADLDNLAGRIK